jgi:hypothetical protein
MEIKDVESSSINIEELKRWITCFALVTFDIDEGNLFTNRGQNVSHIVPDV